MKRFVFIISFYYALLPAQPKEGIEFKVHTISGFVIDSSNSEPMMDVDVDIFMRNNIRSIQPLLMNLVSFQKYYRLSLETKIKLLS